jgi:hypothetical protein
VEGRFKCLYTVKKSSTVLNPTKACKVFSYSRYPFDLETGGRNQNTQLFFKVCTDGGLSGLELVRDELDAFETTLFAREASFEVFSEVGVLVPPRTLPKFSAFPGDLGVFADPKALKAPDPRPKALAAPAVGEFKALAGDGRELKGLGLPWDDRSPVRFEFV